MPISLTSWLLVAALFFIAAPTARAAPPTPEAARRAGEIFAEAVEHFAQSRYSLAGQLFERANEEAPNGRALLNAGLSWDRAGDAARAVDALRRALTMRGDLRTEDLAEAEAILGQSASRVGELELPNVDDATFSVGHRVAVRGPARIALAPGSHTVSWVRRGVKGTRMIEIAAGKATRLELGPIASAPPSPAAAPPVPSTSPSTAGQTQSIFGWVFIGLSGPAIGTAIGLGVWGLNERDRWEETGRTDEDARDKAIELRTATNVMWVTAGAFAATGLILVLTAPSDEPVTKQSAGPCLTGTWGGICGAF